jgi:YD repeat-containing protein
MNTYDATRINEGSTSVHAEFCFEPSTGFLQRVRRLAGTTQGLYDLLTVRTRDAAGNMASEARYGGDYQYVASGGVCSIGLPLSPVYRMDHEYQYGTRRRSWYVGPTGAMGFYTMDTDIDQNTGFARVSRDVATFSTTFEYDALGRVRWTIPFYGARVEQIYTRATSSMAPATLDVKRWNTYGTVVLAQEQQVFDSFGQLWKERWLMPNGAWSTRRHAYNAQGWVTFTSEIEANANPINGTTFAGFDPFGRPSTTTTADGKVTTMAYLGMREWRQTKWIRVAGDASTDIEQASITTKVFDRQNRLFQVREPSRPGGAEATTQYAYHPSGNISSVITTGAEATQTRLSTFDGRGFLVSEQKPELGATGNGSVAYYRDAAGHIRGRTIAGGTSLSYSYDAAERLTEVRDPGIMKTFSYGLANAPYDWRLGKLTQAVRYNENLPIVGSVSVTETYTYGGPGGRLSGRVTTTSESAATVSQASSYTDLGTLINPGYPSCTMGCPFGSVYATNSLLAIVGG